MTAIAAKIIVVKERKVGKTFKVICNECGAQVIDWTCHVCAPKSVELAATDSQQLNYAIAQLVTDFIASHDLADVQLITMRNFLDWVAQQHN